MSKYLKSAGGIMDMNMKKKKMKLRESEKVGESLIFGPQTYLSDFIWQVIVWVAVKVGCGVTGMGGLMLVKCLDKSILISLADNHPLIHIRPTLLRAERVVAWHLQSAGTIRSVLVIATGALDAVHFHWVLPSHDIRSWAMTPRAYRSTHLPLPKF